MLWLICNATDNDDVLDIEDAAAEEQVVLVEADTFEAAVALMHKELDPNMIVLTKEQYEAEDDGDMYLIPVEPLR